MININGESWKILLVHPYHSGLNRGNNTFALGCCDDNLKTIFINGVIDDYKMKKVLCHELVHACMYSYNVKLNYVSFLSEVINMKRISFSLLNVFFSVVLIATINANLDFISSLSSQITRFAL